MVLGEGGGLRGGQGYWKQNEHKKNTVSDSFSNILNMPQHCTSNHHLVPTTVNKTATFTGTPFNKIWCHLNHRYLLLFQKQMWSSNWDGHPFLLNTGPGSNTTLTIKSRLFLNLSYQKLISLSKRVSWWRLWGRAFPSILAQTICTHWQCWTSWQS